MMFAINTFETWVNFYQTARRNSPEDRRIHKSKFIRKFWRAAYCQIPWKYDE
jgi:hypothetical protein